jgi:hypothetical protein
MEKQMNLRVVKVKRESAFIEIAGLHLVKQGEHFLMFEPSGELVVDGIALEDGCTNNEGINCIKFREVI